MDSVLKAMRSLQGVLGKVAAGSGGEFWKSLAAAQKEGR